MFQINNEAFTKYAFVQLTLFFIHNINISKSFKSNNAFHEVSLKAAADKEYFFLFNCSVYGLYHH